MRKSVTLTLTLPKDLLRQLNTSCKEQDLNRSQLIRKAIRAHQFRLSAKSEVTKGQAQQQMPGAPRRPYDGPRSPATIFPPRARAQRHPREPCWTTDILSGHFPALSDARSRLTKGAPYPNQGADRTDFEVPCKEPDFGFGPGGKRRAHLAVQEKIQSRHRKLCEGGDALDRWNYASPVQFKEISLTVKSPFGARQELAEIPARMEDLHLFNISDTKMLRLLRSQAEFIIASRCAVDGRIPQALQRPIFVPPDSPW